MLRARALSLVAFFLTPVVGLSAPIDALDALGQQASSRIDPGLVTASTPKERHPPLTATPFLRVQNVRLEKPAADAGSESALLKFELLNEGPVPLTSITLEVSVREGLEGDVADRLIVRPFSIRGEAVLEAGHRIEFGMLLRNISADCSCTANVEVTSVRALTR
jgi:hypothetical protein